jgi:hypothetical protein
VHESDVLRLVFNVGYLLIALVLAVKLSNGCMQFYDYSLKEVLRSVLCRWKGRSGAGEEDDKDARPSGAAEIEEEEEDGDEGEGDSGRGERQTQVYEGTSGSPGAAAGRGADFENR